MALASKDPFTVHIVLDFQYPLTRTRVSYKGFNLPVDPASSQFDMVFSKEYDVAFFFYDATSIHYYFMSGSAQTSYSKTGVSLLIYGDEGFVLDLGAHYQTYYLEKNYFNGFSTTYFSKTLAPLQATTELMCIAVGQVGFVDTTALIFGIISLGSGSTYTFRQGTLPAGLEYLSCVWKGDVQFIFENPLN